MAAGSSAAPACARTLRTHPQPAPSPDGAVGAGLGFSAANPKPSARRDPNRAELACLGARWQVRGSSRSIRSARHRRDSQDRCLVRPPRSPPILSPGWAFLHCSRWAAASTCSARRPRAPPPNRTPSAAAWPRRVTRAVTAASATGGV
eukprot:scaffold72089_cov61-Phaeocystis_antarctica.AAC.1